MQLLNPATEEIIGHVRNQPWEEVEAALQLAGGAERSWPRVDMARRCAMMTSAAGLLRQRRSELAGLMTREMGKTSAASESEIDKCALTCDYFASHAAGMLTPRSVPTEAARSYIRYEPLGCVLAVMPWNFPFWQVFRFAAPALVAGNVALLKHASNVPLCSDAIAAIFRDAGFPPGVFGRLFLSQEATARAIGHPVVKAVTLTGSEEAGRAVAAAAGRALKKTVLELGGSDAFIVLADADIHRVAAAAAAARCINAGQSCIAAKRFIVEQPVVGAFQAALVARMSGLKVGDPADRSTDVGPMARLDLLEQLHDQVCRSVKAGAVLLSGGRRLPRRGFFYEPTVLGSVRPGMPAAAEETFGPVAAVISAADADEAVGIANDSAYGLGASVWSGDAAAAERLAQGLEAGCVFINEPVKSDPRLPFGGIKRSGYGRELSELGMHEFLNIKSVWVQA